MSITSRMLRTSTSSNDAVDSDNDNVTNDGRLFHAQAAATEKARSPIVLQRVTGTTTAADKLERRLRLVVTSVARLMLSARYTGATLNKLPCWTFTSCSCACIRLTYLSFLKCQYQHRYRDILKISYQYRIEIEILISNHHYLSVRGPLVGQSADYPWPENRAISQILSKSFTISKQCKRYFIHVSNQTVVILHV